MTTPPPSEGPSPAEEAEMTIARWMEWDQGRSVARMREEIRAALDRVASATKRSAHLEDAQAAHEEGMRMNRAAGEARRNGRVGVAYYRDSDAETAGRIADLILAKVPR